MITDPSRRLFYGHHVLDSAVPSKLLNMCVRRTEREFTHMRYSAVTCDPNSFKDEGFTLRQLYYDPPRLTELLIALTLCNEDEEMFCRTMHGIIQNITHLCARDRSKTWGREGWKKVVVCIVGDGRTEINMRTLSVITTIGAYQEGIAKVGAAFKTIFPDAYPVYRTPFVPDPSQHIFTSTPHRVRPLSCPTVFSLIAP